MPVLIRVIAQGLVIVTTSLLTFLGIAPNATVPTQQEMQISTEERQALIDDILNNLNETSLEVDADLLVPFKVEDVTPPEEPVQEVNYEPVQNTPVQKQPTTQYEPKNPVTVTNNPVPTQNIPAPQPVEEATNSNDIESALVNIICTEKSGRYITANTGSGVIISPNGVVITNSHVAQFFILEKVLNNYSCALYKENIPTYGYTAEILYISPDWIKENANLLNATNPRGTGEDDYALLYITGITNPSLSKPKQFDYISPNVSADLAVGQNVTVAGYPGAPSSILDLAKSVNLKVDETEIEDVYTFGNNQIDVVSTGVTPVAAKGASGGGVFRNNRLIGLIVTTGGSGNSTYINAITLNYINRDLIRDNENTLNNLISGSLGQKADDFWQTYGDTLSDALLNEL